MKSSSNLALRVLTININNTNNLNQVYKSTFGIRISNIPNLKSVLFYTFSNKYKHVQHTDNDVLDID